MKIFSITRHLLLLGLAMAVPALAQDAATATGEEEGKEGSKRVQYQLVRPDEKGPETVKPEENNPFMSEAEANRNKSPEDTEENRVQNKLLSLPIGGRKVGRSGQIELIMLGDILLKPGMRVPALFPGQQVALKVKNISHQFIELAWQDREATGLPPKIMLIPIDIDPSVTRVMPGGSGDSRNVEKMRFNDLISRNGTPQAPAGSPTTQSAPPPPRAQPLEEPSAPQSGRSSTPPPPAPPPAPSAAEELSKGAMRMLFGPSTPPPAK